MTQTAPTTKKHNLRSLDEILADSPRGEGDGQNPVTSPRVLTTLSEVLSHDYDLFIEPAEKAKLLRKYGRKSEEWREYLTALFEETNNVTVKGEARKFFDEFAHLFG